MPLAVIPQKSCRSSSVRTALKSAFVRPLFQVCGAHVCAKTNDTHKYSAAKGVFTWEHTDTGVATHVGVAMTGL